MISMLTGRVAEILHDGAVVDVNGVGYRVWMPVTAVAALPGRGQTVTVHTHLHVREDILQLYGFTTVEQRGLFEILIGVNGIGPKGALAVLGVHTPEALRRAVSAEDLDALTMIPGVGKKTAQRMILELREKLSLPDSDGVPGATPERRAALTEVRGALEGLGYSAGEVRRAIEPLADGDGEPVEALLKRALRELAKA